MVFRTWDLEASDRSAKAFGTQVIVGNKIYLLAEQC